MSRYMYAHYGNGTLSIGASDMPEFGKRPSLFITRGCAGHKVASFSSQEAAQEFTDALGELLGYPKEADE